MLERDIVLPHLVARRAAEDPDGIVGRDAGRPELTYREFHEGSLLWADAFRRVGVAPGDLVLTLVPNTFESYQVWLGLAWLRAVEVPTNTAYRGAMLRHLVTTSQARVAVISGRYLGVLAEVAAELPSLETVIVPDAQDHLPPLPFRVVPSRDLLADAKPADDLDGPDVWDPAVTIFTSGTTGPSKGVILPWASVYSGIDWPGFGTMIGRGEGIYGIFPTFHLSGKAMLYLAARNHGWVLMREQFSVSTFLDDARRFGIVASTLVGSMAQFLLSQPERADDAESPLARVLIFPIIPQVEEFKRRFGVDVCTMYGLTEGGCLLVSDGFQLPAPGSAGRPRSDAYGYEYRLVDEHDRPLGPRETGELIVRSSEPWVMNLGYLGVPDASFHAWRNGWFHTGDAFRYDDAGNWYFVDRVKDAIRRRGENISSFEVEAHVAQHSDVVEVAAVSVASEHLEDEVKVCVVLRERAAVAPADLLEFLAPRMPAFMLPRYVEFVDVLPRTEATLRVQKVKLREAPLNERTWDRERGAWATP